jgi:hypothetical protein
MPTQLILASVILGICALSTSAQTTRPHPATTQAVDPKVEKLIRDLADDNPKIREAAATTLKKLGKDAIPALQAAALDPDPQIRVSAADLIAALKNPPNPVQPPVARNSNPSGLGVIELHGQIEVQFRMEANGNARNVRNMMISENGNKISIHEDNNSIDMEVTPANGEPKRYTARNATELKGKQPDAYKIYQRYVHDN